MGKLTVLVIVLVAIWLVLRGVARSRAKPSPRAPAAENMVSCAHCRVNLPQSEAILDGERSYCSEEHRRSGVR